MGPAADSIDVQAIADNQLRNAAGQIAAAIVVLDGKLADGKRIGERNCGWEITLGSQRAIERGEVEFAGN